MKRLIKKIADIDKNVIKIYEDVLNGNSKRFPMGFWQDTHNAEVCVKHLIENILNWDEDDIKKKLNYNIFKQYKLKGMITQVYNDSPFEAIKDLYPDIKPWELEVSPKMWDNDKIIEATKWLIEEKLGWDADQVKNELTADVIRSYGLETLIKHFNGNIYNLIEFTYPGWIKPWEYKKQPKNLYDDQNILNEALIWFFEEKMQLFDKESIDNTMYLEQSMIDNGVTTLFNYFGNLNNLKNYYYQLKGWN